MTSARLPLGKLLVDAGLLEEDALEGVLRDQSADGRRLGEILVARGLVSSAQMTQMLSHQLSLPWVSLSKVVPDAQLLSLIPKTIAQRHHIVPVYLRRRPKPDVLYVATDDPTHDVAVKECAEAAKMDVRLMVAATDDVRSAIDRWYGGGAKPLDLQAISIPAGAMRVAASVAPPAMDDRPTPVKPLTIPKARAPKVEELELDDDDVIPHISGPPVPSSKPVVLVVGGRGAFARKCRLAAGALDAEMIRSDLAGALLHARTLTPFAIVVPEDVYAFDRLGLTKLSVEVNALLVIWSDDLEPEYLEPLLDTALKRRAPH